MTKHTPGPGLEALIASVLPAIEQALQNCPARPRPIGDPPENLEVCWYTGRDNATAFLGTLGTIRELLQAATDAQTVIDACIPYSASVPVPGVSRKLRAAIAKAEGKD